MRSKRTFTAAVILLTLISKALAIAPCAQEKEKEKTQSLKFCPCGKGLTTATEELPAKEGKGKKIAFSGERGDSVVIGTDSVIEINSDITSNQIWTADNTYHIVADINVRALLVIEPGTVVSFANGRSMSVNSGGVLVSVGTPGNPVVYTSDSGTPGYADYYCPIYIESTASSSTKITYSYIEYAYVGIAVINNRLDTNIENNYLYHNVYGIVEYGTEHTNISNNLVFGSYYSGIEVFLGDPNGQGSANSVILVENNTCDYYQDNGITIHGVEDANESGFVILANNIVSGSYQYGLALVDWYMYATVANTGYFDNAGNKNWEFDETNPVVLTQNPYETGMGFMPICYIDQTCPLVDAGSHFIYGTDNINMLGRTTSVSGVPDSNILDIGFHYPNWNSTNAGSASLSADFDHNGIVNLSDLCQFTDYWLYDYQKNYEVWWWDFDDSGVIDFNDLVVVADYWLLYFDFYGYAEFAQHWQKEVDHRFQNTKYDLTKNGFVDFTDFSLFASQWLSSVALPNLSVELSQGASSVSGELGVSLVEHSEELLYYIFWDGECRGMFSGDSVGIPTEGYRNGEHEIKVIALSISGEIWLGSLVVLSTDNSVSCYTGGDTYKYNGDYNFSGFYNGGGENLLQLQLENTWGDVVWSDSATGNFNFTIPNSALDTPYNELTMQEASAMTGDGLIATLDLPGYIKAIVKDFDVTNDPGAQNAKSLLVLKKGGFLRNWPSNRRGVWREFLLSCQRRGLDPTIVLYEEQATRANIQTAFQVPSVEAIYIISDGNRRVGDPDKDPNCPWRTWFATQDGPFFSYLKRNWTGNPEDYVNLGGYENGYSVADSIDYFNAKSHLHVFHDCCKNGPMCMPHSFYNRILMVPEPSDNNYNENDYNRTGDMAWAYGINPDSSNRNYMGWRGFAFKGNPLMRYNTFTKALWNELGDGDTYIVAFGEAAHADLGCYIPAQNFSHVGDLGDRFVP